MMGRHCSSNPAGGFSLVELMVALVAGLIVSLAVLAFFLSSLRTNGEFVESTQLNQELRNSLDLIVRDLRRAGYDDNSLAFVATATTSPFAPICITASSFPNVCVTPGTAGDCILYAYDRTNLNGATASAGTAGSIDVVNGEVRGIRRRSAGSVGVVEFAQSSTSKPACGGGTANYNTNPPACGSSQWCALSDPRRINISSLQFTDLGSTLGAVSADRVGIRRIRVSITGTLDADTAVSRTIQTDIKLRSDCLRASSQSVDKCKVSP